jgi:hypothetical protein
MVNDEAWDILLYINGIIRFYWLVCFFRFKTFNNDVSAVLPIFQELAGFDKTW